MKKGKLFPIAEVHTKLMAISTGEFRHPKKGEYFISGAIPEAYLTPNDLSCPYNIATRVKVKHRTVTTVVEEL